MKKKKEKKKTSKSDKRNSLTLPYVLPTYLFVLVEQLGMRSFVPVE